MKIKHRELHRVVPTAIIHKNGKYLIIRRSLNKKAFPGQWTVPGGGLEVDDYINSPKTTPDSPQWYFAVENCLKREVKEETSLEVEKLQYLCDLTFIRPDGIPVVTLSYYCNYKGGDIKLNKENIDYKWVNFEEAKKYDLIPGLLGEIKMVDEIIKGKDPNNIKYKNLTQKS